MARKKKKRLRIEKGRGKKKRKPGNAAERARRRRKIRKKLEGKLRESADKRKAKGARSGSFLDSPCPTAYPVLRAVGQGWTDDHRSHPPQLRKHKGSN